MNHLTHFNLLAALSITLVLGAAAIFAETASTRPSTQPDVAPALSFTMKSLDGKDVNLAHYRGKVILMVNTASKCGFTPQYAGLEMLHEKYADKGLAVLGFPCNDFGKQEPGTALDISTFCTEHYGVKFDMFSKIDVLPMESQAPLYKYLTGPDANKPFPGKVKWNFEKFLIARNGTVVARFLSAVKPESDEVVKAIETELAK
jgi:glutathione peroxidase